MAEIRVNYPGIGYTSANSSGKISSRRFSGAATVIDGSGNLTKKVKEESKKSGNDDFKLGSEIKEELRVSYPNNDHVNELIESNNITDIMNYMRETKNLKPVIHLDTLDEMLQSSKGVAALEDISSYIDSRRLDITLYNKLEYLLEAHNSKKFNPTSSWYETTLNNILKRNLDSEVTISSDSSFDDFVVNGTKEEVTSSNPERGIEPSAIENYDWELDDGTRG